MKFFVLLILAMFLSFGTSCTPEKIAGPQTEQDGEFAGDPPSEETGEEVDPND